MKARRLTAVLALVLALVLAVSGCTQKPAETQAPTTEATTESVKETEKETTTEAPTEKETTTEKETEAPTETETEPEETPPDESTVSDNLSSVFQDFAKGNFDGDTIETVDFIRTGVLPKIEMVNPEIIGEEEIAEMDRAMRAYVKGVDDLVINDAPGYYFYDHFTDDQRDIYDAFLLLAEDPTTTDNIVTLKTDRDVTSDDFALDFYTAWLGLGYDHPELWWVSYWNGTTNIQAYFGETNDTLYFAYENAYETWEEDCDAFNEVTQDIIDSIDPTLPDEEILRIVHDEIINMAVYDYDLLERQAADYGHTAFGCFVHNTAGTPHYCVCDGYSQAYLYILQQLGFYGTVVTGNAGDAGADGGMGGHAWSIIQSDGIWYEIDTTWDDYTELQDQVAEQYGTDSLEYSVFSELYNDEDFMDVLQHHMFMITTDEMNDYVPTDDLTYYTQDGQYRLTLVGASQRVRYCDDSEMKDSIQGVLTALLPIADDEMHDDAFFRDVDDEPTTEEDTTEEDTTEEDTTEEDTSEEETESVEDTTEEDTTEEDTTEEDTTEEETTTEKETEKETKPAKEDYSAIVGMYYVSSFAGFDQTKLEKFYGKDYYKGLSMFELKKNGTGAIYELGNTTTFRYTFDGETLVLKGTTGGTLELEYEDGNFIMEDFYGNEFVFSKLAK
ncbi:MAG: hypothetical protein IKS18_06980 [Lachnospiraceae bacterium]|nr:hypothetical protein [Lachnospiraceae bacterium]